jgi:alanyl-tRNA synthetase
LARHKAKIATISVGKAEDDIQMINGIKVLAKRVNADKPAALRDLADKFRDKIQSGIVVLGSTEGSKVFLIVVVTKDLTKNIMQVKSSRKLPLMSEEEEEVDRIWLRQAVINLKTWIWLWKKLPK